MSQIAGLLEGYKEDIKQTFSHFATKETKSKENIKKLVDNCMI